LEYFGTPANPHLLKATFRPWTGSGVDDSRHNGEPLDCAARRVELDQDNLPAQIRRSPLPWPRSSAPSDSGTSRLDGWIARFV